MKAYIDTSLTTVTEDGEETQAPDLGGFETDGDVHYSVMDRGDGTCVARVTAFPATMQGIKDASATAVLTDDEAGSALMAHRPDATLENLDQPDVEVDDELDALSPSDVLTTPERRRAELVHNWTRELSRAQREEILVDNPGARGPRDLVHALTADELRALLNDYGIGYIPSHLPTSTVARSVVQLPTAGRRVLQDQEVTALNKAAAAAGRERSSELSSNTHEDNAGEMGATALDLLSGSNAAHEEMLDYVKGRNGQGPPWDGDANPPAVGRPQG